MYDNITELKNACENGEFVGNECTVHLFWKSKLSNWHRCSFTYHGKTFSSGEQFFMYYKALLFKDYKIAEEILHEVEPHDIKALGRMVSNYDEGVWDSQRIRVMYFACLERFRQVDYLRDLLLSTGDKVLAESSPYDRIWGTGIGDVLPYAHNPKMWDGQNLLGFVLMKVRDTLRTGTLHYQDLDFDKNA